ncbi:Toluene efflux pump periplasmic linker protein TtgD precursor [Rubripirellula lacrimiformis]|uniref:Toluene efflux pump periplasmic linker protein TtgD n=2 Tax=Rubripirellula lacrimiformis TaxID=1930273 RepID=A0A517NHQ0_9BACT|nr:Toluene efflux pump periplasmic linker protein TtgD precursor [Rubripirellula lacrimiformis]
MQIHRSARYHALIIGNMIILAGCSPKQTALKPQQDVRDIPVKTVALATTEVQRTTLQPASIHAFYRAEIRARATGFVSELKVDIGDYVETGAELAVIHVPEIRKQREITEARIQRYEAEEQRAQAGIQLADARVRSSQAMLAEARSQMAGVEASLAGSESEFNRTQDLVDRGSLQNRMLDEVRMKRDSEAARKDAMASSIQSAQAEVAVAEAQAAAAKADLVAAKAETQVARRQLDEIDVMIQFATLRAPFTGIVTERNIEPGDLVRQSNEVGNGRPLFVVSQVDKVRVRIPVPESDAPLVRPGDEVRLTFPSFASEAPIVGNVTRRSGDLDPSTRTMMVEVELDNADGKLLPGMFGQASINLSTKIAANMLPSQAIRIGENGNAYVYVVGDDETVSIAEVTMGMDDGNSIEVLAGIQPGQRVIGSHLKRFVDGQKVVVLGDRN